MTIEGILIIVVGILLLIKLFQNRHILKTSTLTQNYSKLSILETIWYFCISISLGLILTPYIFILVFINALVWTSFHLILKRYNYSLLSWLTLIIFWLNFYTSIIHYEKLPQPEIWYYTILMIEIALIIILIFDVLGEKLKFIAAILVSFIIAVFTLIPSLNIAYYYTVNNNRSSDSIGTGQIHALFQTDFVEAYDFVKDYFNIQFLLIILTLLILIVGGVFIQSYIKRKVLNTGLFFTMAVSLLLFINLNIWEFPAFPKLIFTSYENYKIELQRFRSVLEKRALGIEETPASKEENKELYIFVIGESLNKNHMSLYGYARNTTPQLDKIQEEGDLMVFNQFFSSNTHTVPVLNKALTEANNLNDKEFYNAASILNILNAANFETYWLSNQVKYGVWDNPITALAESAKHQYFINSNVGENTNTQFYDGKLLDELKTIIDGGIEKNTVIFMHLMGNHGYYERRYPPSFKVFDGPLDKSIFGNHAYNQETLNHYDNSVFYNDYVVSEIYKYFKKIDTPAGFMYFSDHSEDVLKNLQHNSGSFTFDMTQIPFILSFSNVYKAQYPEKVETLEQRKETLYSTDLLYDLMIGITGVQTDFHQSNFDLSSKNFKLLEKDLYTLDGKIKYADEENKFYARTTNISKIDSIQSLNRILAHRVNSLGALAQVNFQQIGFETDVVFKENNLGSFHFEIGHDENAMAGIPLDSFLVQLKSPKKVWLDIKNISAENIAQVKNELIRLDELYAIKSFIIIETGCTIAEISELSKLGFNTSYYLPTWLKDTNEEALKEQAILISEQIKAQDIQSISFDIALYSFVKNHLEAYINSQIKYHTWDLSLHFEDINLVENLNNKNYFLDERLETILIQYKSDFDI